ncbi:hypothetical protein HDC91_002770 [Mucilaginibacter sp. AK015]|nr:hypothetical protein [Mucilaginibacter sp. AK015]
MIRRNGEKCVLGSVGLVETDHLFRLARWFRGQADQSNPEQTNHLDFLAVL